MYENRMIDSVEGSRKVKETETSYLLFTDGIDEMIMEG